MAEEYADKCIAVHDPSDYDLYVDAFADGAKWADENVCLDSKLEVTAFGVTKVLTIREVIAMIVKPTHFLSEEATEATPKMTVVESAARLSRPSFIEEFYKPAIYEDVISRLSDDITSRILEDTKGE